MTHESFDDQVAAYALGALDGEDRRAFEAHLAAGCTRCEAALRDAGETLASIVVAGPRAAPPAHVKDALMRRTAVPARVPSSHTALQRAWLRWTAALAAAMVVGGFFTGMYVAARYEARLGAIARDTSRLREQLRGQEAALRERAAVYQSVIDLLRDPATRVVALHAPEPGSEPRGRVVWHDAAGGQLLVAKLPPAPEGKAYEVWTIAAGRPSPAGVFRVDADGAASHRVAPTGAPVDALAVTLEPATGVSSPTGPIVLSSSK